MEEKTTSHYIFFLKTSENLNPIFFLMSDLFKQLNIVLMPVTATELKKIDRHRKHQIIIFRNDFGSAQIFMELRKTYLDFAMSRGHVAVYDISSFSEAENSSKYVTQKSYYYFPLPINIKQFVVKVSGEYFKNKHELEEWPGGRKSKLPANNSKI